MPVDGSDTAIAGLQEAVRLAADQRARRRLISVVDEHIVMQNFDDFSGSDDLIDALRDAGKKAIKDALVLVHKHDEAMDSWSLRLSNIKDASCNRPTDNALKAIPVLRRGALWRESRSITAEVNIAH